MGTNSNRAALWAALFCIAGFAMLGWSYMTRGPTLAAGAASLDTLIIETKAGPKTFKIELARTPEQQATGLMFRTKLVEGEGMLFPHSDAGEVSMWMRNTFIPLDMVFIRADGIVHRIEANTEPMSERIIPSNGPVGGVLEIAGGSAEKLGIAAGDRVRHAMFDAAPVSKP